MKMSMLCKRVLAATLATAVALPAAALVHPGTLQYRDGSMTVSFADLNLDRKVDVAILYERLQSAARRVCDKPDGRNLTAMHNWRQCQDEALDSAVSAVGDAALTRLHAG